MAQMLKDEIRQSILDNALNDFMTKGFKSTSMKGIAQKSGIAVGNIYNYFKDKETLYYSLVRPVLDSINVLFDEPINQDINMLEGKINRFINIYKSNQDVFVMLLENSSNTKFESLKHTIIENFTSAIIRYKAEMLPLSQKTEDNIFLKAFTNAYINGIITVLAEKVDEKIKLERLYEFLSFMKDGLKARLINISGVKI